MAATSKQIPVDNPHSCSLMSFMYAVEANDIETAVNVCCHCSCIKIVLNIFSLQILNKELSTADPNNEQQLIGCTKYAIKFLFRHEKYQCM